MHRALRLKLFLSAILPVIAPTPTVAASCEIAQVMFGNINLEIVDHGNYESALVRNNDFNNREQNYGAIRGEITVDRGAFAVRNVKGVVVGTISPELQIEGFDEVCDKSKPVMVRWVQHSVYVIVNGEYPVGMIKGRFPKNGFGVDDAPLVSQRVRQDPAGKAFFVGRWYAKNSKLCKGRAGETEGLLAYTERQAIEYESSCDIVSVTPQANRLELKMKCASEGMTSDEREVVQLTRNGHLTRTTFADGKTYTFEYARCP